MRQVVSEPVSACQCQSVWQLSNVTVRPDLANWSGLCGARGQFSASISFVAARAANSACRSGVATTEMDQYLQSDFLIGGARLRLTCATVIHCLFQQTACIMEDNVPRMWSPSFASMHEPCFNVEMLRSPWTVWRRLQAVLSSVDPQSG